MTRINLVPVDELADQHLFAEFREIKMVSMALRRSLAARNVDSVLARIPPAFTLGTGHVMFFYDKGDYLVERYSQIRCELKMRGVKFNPLSPLDLYRVQWDYPWCGEYEPTPEALALVRARIAAKIAMRPDWYRYRGERGRMSVAPITPRIGDRAIGRFAR